MEDLGNNFTWLISPKCETPTQYHRMSPMVPLPTIGNSIVKLDSTLWENL